MNLKKHYILIALAALLTGAGCQEEAPPPQPHAALSYHGAITPGASLGPVQEACGGTICKLQGGRFAELEYVTDASAQVQGYLLRTSAPQPPNVQESQQRFERLRMELTALLGPGESFLRSGDPTYWPRRDKGERVVTLTSSEQGFAILAVGAVGPDAEKIPAQGAARDPKAVATWWSRVSGLPEPADSAR